MKNKSILTAILLALTPVLGLAQSVISINIAGGNANSPSGGGGGGQGIVTGNAGLGQLGNWNNAVGSSNVGDGLTVPALVSSTGSATAASFSWVTNNTWSTSSADGAGTDQDMLSGYIDNFHANGSITVAGLGTEFTGPGYNVLVYYQTDNSGMTAGFTVADNAGNTDTRFGHQVAVNNWPLAGGELTDGYIISTETANNTLFSANIVQLSGFSGSDFTMTGNGGAVGSARARPSGIQIISLGGAVDDDGDGDGLPNAWEIQHNLDPNDNGDVDPVNGAAGDPDADTLSNLDEFNRGTDPRDDDSDDDNLGDAVEGNTGTYVSPTQTGSDPLDPDSDGDTLEDGAEVEANPFVTDPNNADTDGDGLDDASEEAANPFLTDPTKEDTDGDGFSDSAEINLGSDPTDENDAPIGVERGLTISINIAGGNANSPSGGGGGGQGIVTGNAGLGQLGNWNNAVGSSNVGDGLTVPALVSSTGSATAASFSWVTNNTWSTSSADGAGTDQDMLSGYIDNFHANGSITVAGLGTEFTGPGYNVLVYYQTDNSGMTAGFTVADNAGNTDTRFGHQVAVNNWPLAGGELTDGYIISTEAEGNTLFSANIVQLSGFSGSDFTMTGNAGSVGSARARPSGIQIISLGGTEPLPLEVSGRDMLTFRWPSQRGQLYTLRSETDPSVADPIDWPVYDGHQEIEATPPENTLTIPRPPEAERFFVIEGFAAPPESIFADDFESGLGLWTIGSDGAVGTEWELGTPSGVGPVAANSFVNCIGTNLSAGYAQDADVWLRSPPIDLTAVAGATVNYFQVFDIEASFDKGRVAVIDCADDSVLAVIEDDIDGASLDWALVSRALPPQALGKIVKIEFRLITDVFDGSVFAGWYLDDFMVTVP